MEYGIEENANAEEIKLIFWQNEFNRIYFCHSLKRKMYSPGYKEIYGFTEKGNSFLRQLLIEEVPSDYRKEVLESLGLPSDFLDWRVT